MTPSSVRAGPSPPPSTATTRERLHRLMVATNLLVEGSDLIHTLEQIAAAASSLVETDRAGVGLVGADGLLEHFLWVGPSTSSEGSAAQARHLFDEVLREGTAVSSAEPGDTAFLGVPISVRGHVLGGIYLTADTGPGFTGEDEEALRALAATAAMAVDGARTVEGVEARRRADDALIGVVAALTETGGQGAAGIVAAQAMEGFDAALVLVTTPGKTPGSMLVEAASGRGADPLVDRVVTIPGSTAVSPIPGGPGSETEQRRAGAALGAGPSIETSLPLAGALPHSLWLCRTVDTGAFSAAEIAGAVDFASRAGAAAQLAHAGADRAGRAATEAHSQVAAGLHDQVIRLVSRTGLGLETFARAYPTHQRAILRHVEVLDAAVAAVRTAIVRLDPAAADVVAPVGAGAGTEELTLRERQALDLIVEGLTNRQIGERLGLSEKTVKNYVSSLLAKLGMERRTQAAVYGARLLRAPEPDRRPSSAEPPPTR